VEITLTPALDTEVSPVVTQAVATGFIPSLFSQDDTLWGDDAQPEASIRLGWLVDPHGADELVAEIEALRDELRHDGVRRVILCGMGGSSLAPEVMAQASGVQLTVVDTIHPDVLGPLSNSDLSDAVIVVSSKSGSTVETDSARRVLEDAMRIQGIEPKKRIIVVTDPGSPLESFARSAGYRVFLGDPRVGGRFSALTAFGLVPAGLAGVPLAPIIANAHNAWLVTQANSASNPGLLLGAALVSGHPQRNKVLLRDSPSTPGFGNWVEQLVAESTGKHQKGVLPVCGSSHLSLQDALTIGPVLSGSDVEILGAVGELFVLWEVATAFACHILGVNPFDQPNVESAKVAARDMLTSGGFPREFERPLGPIDAWSAPPLHDSLSTSSEAISWLLAHSSPQSYVGLCIFGPGGHNEGLWRGAAHGIEAVTNRPVTLGFGPRFLHSTGQFHKGGPLEGIFLQIIQVPHRDIHIPGRDFSATQLLVAQAHGDASVLAATGQPVLSLTVSSDDEVRKLAVLLTDLG
jgi:glucose-6-phosphate isomerase